ncbi:MAG TPA: hypothetical protein DCR04_05785 [Flavobacteriales bacterium]|nr:hypothetical protein [Flavobacteriales bacterium]
MDQFFSTVLGPSIRRTLVFYILPGSAFVFIVLLFVCELELLELIKSFSESTYTALFYTFLLLIASYISGFIFENFGSRWEAKHCKNKVLDYISKDEDGVNGKVKAANSDLTPEQIFSFGWERFLTLSYDANKVTGHRFLRYMLERLKFELSFGFVMYVSYSFLILKSIHTAYVSFEKNGEFAEFDHVTLALIVGMVILNYYLTRIEAPKSAQTLHECRLLLVTSQDKEWKSELEHFSRRKEDSKKRGKKSWTKFLYIAAILLSFFMIRSLFKHIRSRLLKNE